MKSLVYTMRAVCLLLVASLVLSGCTVSSAGISPSTTNLTSADNYTVLSDTDVVGSSWGLSLVGIPFSVQSTENAKASALRSSGADALIDVTTQNETYNLFFIGLFRIKVSGKPIKMI